VLWLSGIAVDGGDADVSSGPLERVCGDIPIVYSTPVPVAVVDDDGREHPVDVLEKKKVLAFCGIARPDRFFHTLSEMGALVVYTLPFRDHHGFTEDDYAVINHIASRFGVEAVVTTEKDLMRISGSTLSHRLLAVRMGLRVEGDDGLISMIELCVRT
jgi:tetraacyldisaccharide 4'-kinase